MTRRLSSWMALAIGLTLSSKPARANPSARLVYLRGSGAARCPDEDAVRTAVAARLGYDPFFLSAPTTILVEVTRDGNRFAAQVKLIDHEGVERGARRLVGGTGQCADLIGTLALTISLVVDPVSLAVPSIAPQAAPATEDTAAPPPLVRAPIAAVPAVPDPVPTRAPIEPTIRFFAGLSALGTFGSALAPTAGAAAFAGVRREWLSVRIEERGDLVAAAPQPPAAESWALIGLAVSCAHGRAVFVCALAGLEWIRATGEATKATRSSAQTLVAIAGTRLGTEIALSQNLALQPFAEVLVPLQRPRILIGGTSDAFPPVAGDVGISGVARF